MEFLYGQERGSSGSGLLGFFPFILIMVVIYLLMIRPQMKQQRRKKEMLQNLKKGDHVVTAGGIRGTIAGFRNKNSVIVLTVAKNMALHVNRSAISGFAEKETESREK